MVFDGVPAQQFWCLHLRVAAGVAHAGHDDVVKEAGAKVFTQDVSHPAGAVARLVGWEAVVPPVSSPFFVLLKAVF